jgi:hypothetical protein
MQPESGIRKPSFIAETPALWYTGFHQTTAKGEYHGQKKHTKHAGENCQRRMEAVL